MTHFTSQSGSSIEALTGLKAISSEMDADIRVLGCDGASVNTGRNAGICRLYDLWERQPVR